MSQELGSVLYLSSYLVVRHKSLDSGEIAEILARLYTQARYVRNCGIAVGTTLTYMHPLQGNEKAIGMRY